jgi:hypothetical protein
VKVDRVATMDQSNQSLVIVFNSEMRGVRCGGERDGGGGGGSWISGDTHCSQSILKNSRDGN